MRYFVLKIETQEQQNRTGVGSKEFIGSVIVFKYISLLWKPLKFDKREENSKCIYTYVNVICTKQ